MDITQFFAVAKKERRLKDLVQSPPMGRAEARRMIEALRLERFSEFTINPKPEYIRALSDIDIRDKIHADLSKALETVRNFLCKRADIHNEDYYDLHPTIIMIGEHGGTGLCKLHYHGVVGGLPNDFLAEFLKRVRSKIGRTELQMIRFERQYVDYMFKSYTLGEDDKPKELWGKHSLIIV